MTKKRSIQISLPWTGEEEWLALKDPLINGWVTQGPNVAAFEKSFAKKHNVKHAIATSSCTTGLHLILASMGIGEGDEVLVPSFTWISTANAVLYCGATPVFVDVDPLTYNIDPKDIAAKLTTKSKAIIVVHLFGLCVDMDLIRAAIPDNIKIIEDCACAAGASYKNVSAGGLGDAASFSFHPRKSITTGEGGMVTTNNDKLAETVNILRNHGASISEEQRHKGPKPYLLPEFNLLGFNYRMTDLQGAIGLVQLDKLEQITTTRHKWAEFYCKELASIDWLRMPIIPKDGSNHAWQAFVTYVDNKKAPFTRNQIMSRLQAKGISTRPGTHAVHMLGYYRKRFGINMNDLPGARDCDLNTMAIPLHNRMSTDDYNFIVESIFDINNKTN